MGRRIRLNQMGKLWESGRMSCCNQTKIEEGRIQICHLSRDLDMWPEIAHSWADGLSVPKYGDAFSKATALLCQVGRPTSEGLHLTSFERFKHGGVYATWLPCACAWKLAECECQKQKKEKEKQEPYIYALGRIWLEPWSGSYGHVHGSDPRRSESINVDRVRQGRGFVLSERMSYSLLWREHWFNKATVNQVCNLTAANGFMNSVLVSGEGWALRQIDRGLGDLKSKGSVDLELSASTWGLNSYASGFGNDRMFMRFILFLSPWVQNNNLAEMHISGNIGQAT